MKTQVFKVKGRHAFPIAMLNHDKCYPKAQEDIENIRELFVKNSFPTRDEIVIELERYVTSRKDKPDNGVWSCFGWEVIPESIRII